MIYFYMGYSGKLFKETCLLNLVSVVIIGINYSNMKYIDDLLSEYDIYINKSEIIIQQPSLLNVFITFNSYDLIDSSVSFDEKEYELVMQKIINYFVDSFEYSVDKGEYNIIKLIISMKHMRHLITMVQKVTITPMHKIVTYSRN
jgi:hypothetical protein